VPPAPTPLAQAGQQQVAQPEYRLVDRPAAAPVQQGTGLVQAQVLSAPAPTTQATYDDQPDADLDARLASLLSTN